MGYCTYFGGELEITPALTLSDKVEIDKLGAASYEGSYPEWWKMPDMLYMKQVYIHRCDWEVTEDGSGLVNEGEKTYDYVEQLEYLIEHFLKPRGYVVNGQVDWSGEESGDLGTIFVKDNEVRAVAASITIQNPFDSES